MATCTLRFLYAAENREFTFKDVSATQSVRAVKQAVVDKWPTDLPAATKPPDASHVRLLFAGKFLEDEKALQDVPHVSVSDTTTFHVIVMAPPAEVKSTGAPLTNEKVVSVSGTGADANARQGASARCQCIVS